VCNITRLQTVMSQLSLTGLSRLLVHERGTTC